MNRHLSQQEFAECFVGQPLDAELLRHVRECPECRTELDRFGDSVSAFRGVVRDAISARVESVPAGSLQWGETPAPARWQWVLATAVVLVAGLLPIVALDSRLRSGFQENPAEVDASALMDSINLHLSRELPAPMEPMMVTVPNKKSFGASGGIQ